MVKQFWIESTFSWGKQDMAEASLWKLKTSQETRYIFQATKNESKSEMEVMILRTLKTSNKDQKLCVVRITLWYTEVWVKNNP